jgi:hypothetical protein
MTFTVKMQKNKRGQDLQEQEEWREDTKIIVATSVSRHIF